MSGHDRQEWIGAAFVGMGIGAIGLFGALAAASATLPGGLVVATWAIAAGMVYALSRAPFARAFAERLAGRAGEPGELTVPPELLTELDEMRGRMTELEERVDFAERMLARQEQPARLAGGEPA